MMIVCILLGHAYSASMRMLVCTLLNGHTSTATFPFVLREIGDIYGQQMDPRDIPARTTVERMQIEVVVISDQQVFSIICEYYLTTLIEYVS